MNSDALTSSDSRLRFTQADRLKSPKEFHAVYNARSVKHAGPLKVQGMPNHHGHHRLGISISRKVGNAPVRNKIKRMLREAFRLTQHQHAGNYDIVIVVRKHKPLSLEQYQKYICNACNDIDVLWKKRTQRALTDEDST